MIFFWFFIIFKNYLKIPDTEFITIALFAFGINFQLHLIFLFMYDILSYCDRYRNHLISIMLYNKSFYIVQWYIWTMK